MLNEILLKCDQRNDNNRSCCVNCSYGTYCPHNCEKCLDFIHNPNHALDGAPKRKYDCAHMADVYTCKYACRYSSEIIYALKRFKDLKNKDHIKVLSFGCGPCTDLFALEYMKKNNEMCFQSLEYRGIDYSEEVWYRIHQDIKLFENNYKKIEFYYSDMCEIIYEISKSKWVPNLVVFQYVFSDMHKHTGNTAITDFINTFSKYYNSKIPQNTYIILNDVNLGKNYGGGREYFDQLYAKLNSSTMRKGRFYNEHSKNSFYPRGYPYGENSDGEFSENINLFDLRAWQKYSPFDHCASAQMLIKKEV